jgi:copper chaperone
MEGCRGKVNNAELTLNVRGMSCGHCKKAVETAVGVLPSVSKVSASVEEGTVEVKYNPGEVQVDDIKKAIQDLGYDVELG